MIFLLYITQRIISQNRTNVIAQDNDAFIGEKQAVNPLYNQDCSLISEPSDVFTENIFKVLGINPDKKKTVIAFTP